MNQDWAQFFDHALTFLEKVLPGLLAAFIGGYSIGKSKSSSVQKELQETKLKLKYKENEDAVEKDFAGLSDRDIIERAASGADDRAEDKD